VQRQKKPKELHETTGSNLQNCRNSSPSSAGHGWRTGRFWPSAPPATRASRDMSEARNWKRRTRGPSRWPHPRQTAMETAGIEGAAAKLAASSVLAGCRWRAVGQQGCGARRARGGASSAREGLGSALIWGRTGHGTHAEGVLAAAPAVPGQELCGLWPRWAWRVC
jgi:hypothetical protein